MGVPYRARVNERTLLNLPGFHGGAYVYVYVEDTIDRGLLRDPFCEPDCTCCPQNFEPRMSFEIADTLAAALGAFRAALEREFEPYQARERQLNAPRE